MCVDTLARGVVTWQYFSRESNLQNVTELNYLQVDWSAIGVIVFVVITVVVTRQHHIHGAPLPVPGGIRPDYIGLDVVYGPISFAAD